MLLRKVRTMAEKQLLTKKGYEERVALLEELKVVRRKEVAQKLKEAREQGDLSENAEYDAAKDEQRDIEAQIAELEEILSNAEVIQDDAKGGKKVVKLESEVTLQDVDYPEDGDIVYTIVGSSEADSLNNKISNESPLGSALMGQKVGAIVKVAAPVGEIEYKIVAVNNN
ncbi:transcription elongation factor GreA [Lachnospira multipara]|uniref:Transcription elongation factor GreA n=2 Tax=Lachnospira multipara TaxID=28051 RepID=A0A1H5TQQ8_9FIRM|nr:transcription elongation factor GreA [Lachnospira multipara]